MNTKPQHRDQALIRPAQNGDAQAISRLCQQWGYPLTPERAEECILEISKQNGHAIFVSTNHAGDVLGWIHVRVGVLISPDTFAEIAGLIVDEDARRQGVGKALTQAAEDWVRQQGIQKIHVKSNAIRPEAHSFYPSVGFELVKTQKAYSKILK